MNKLNMIEYECDCEICTQMCHAPCCGTVQELKNIIGAGYGNRLMYDDYDDAEESKQLIKEWKNDNIRS